MASAEHEQRARDRNRRLGICLVCRKRPMVNSRVKCAECAAKQVKYMTKLREQRSRDGICRDCTIPLPPGCRFNRCPVCNEASNESIMSNRMFSRGRTW